MAMTPRAMPIPIPAFAPVERPLLLEALLESLVEVGGGMLEVWDPGAADNDDDDDDELAAAAADAVDAMRFITLILLDCHWTWITSAQTVLLLAGMFAFEMVLRWREIGMGPYANVEVWNTFVRSVPMRLAQTLFRISCPAVV